MSDLKWDPRKHDERLPPTEVTTPIVCSADDCKNDTFVQVVKLFDIRKGQLRQIGHRTVIYTCTRCGTEYPLGQNPKAS